MKTGIFIGKDNIEVLKEGKIIFSAGITTFPDDLQKAIEKMTDATREKTFEAQDKIYIFNVEVKNNKLIHSNSKAPYQTWDDNNLYLIEKKPDFIVKEFTMNVLTNSKANGDLSFHESPQVFYNKTTKKLKKLNIQINKNKNTNIYTIQIPDFLTDIYRVEGNAIPFSQSNNFKIYKKK